MRHTLLLMSFAIILVNSVTTNASLPVTVCARYETVDENGDRGTSNFYRIQAKQLKGFDLNFVTRTQDYESSATYFVIFWDKNEATIIKMPSYFISLGGIGYSSGVDQQGRIWHLMSTYTPDASLLCR